MILYAFKPTTTKAKIKAAFQAEQTEQSDYNASLERITDKLATAIIEEILELTVTIGAGIPVSTTGSATAQTGATTQPKVQP
uniref:Uncharacterized protein n=1 Tax=Flavobacterium columnare TaxID=996 RepID=A0AA94JMN5_9FLAO